MVNSTLSRTPKVAMAGNVPKDEDPEGLSSNQTCSHKTTTHLRVISDAAFKKEPEDGYSLRGALFLRCPGRTNQQMVCSHTTGHLLDWACKSQKCVTRSTFSAELLAAGDAPLTKAYCLARCYGK